MVVVAAAFIISIGVAAIVLRRSPVMLRWMAAAVAMFTLCALLVLVVAMHPTADEVTHAYARGSISYVAYQAGVARADCAFDWAAGVGLAGTLLLVGFATLFERIRAYERQARTDRASIALQPGTAPPIS